jgi:signal peptidase II
MNKNNQKHTETNLISQRVKTLAILIILSAIFLALDLWLKSWAAANLQNQADRILINGFLGLTYTRNTGAAFGLGAGFEWSRWVLSGVKIILMGGILWFYSRLPSEKRFWLLRIPLILVFAGGLGNLIDRILFGYVRDMLAFLFIDFPIFNLADVYVVTGVFLSAFVVFFVIKDVQL